MKKIITLAAFAFCLSAANAQDNYTIKSSVKMEGLPEEYAAMAESDKTVFLKNEKSKTETVTMMGSSTEVFDGKKMTAISDAMGNKTGWTATKEELDAVKEDPKKDEVKPKFENTTEKKMIAGYECVKTIVTITDKEKKELKINLWHTDKIKKPVTGTKSKRRGGSGSFDFKEISGYPMQIEFNASQNGMDIHYLETVSEVKTDKLDDSIFVLNTDGYKMLSYKELMDEMKKQQEAYGNGGK